MHDVNFHGLLIAYSENPLLIQINEMIAKMRTELARQLFQREGAVYGAAMAHRKVITNLRQQDMDGSVNAMTAHLEETDRDIRKWHEMKS